MAFGLRVKTGANNAKILRSLEPESVERAIRLALEKFSLLVFRNLVIKGQKLTKSRTGTLNRSWKVTPLPRGLRIVNRARSGGTFYAKFLEFGTKAHRIEPKPGREGRNGRPPALAWRKSGGGPQSSFKGSFNPNNFFFSKGHKVKGIKARKIVFKALIESQSSWAKILATQLQKELT